MALANPWYIDANARHLAAQQRLLAFNAMVGCEGVLLSDHLAVKDLDTPGASITVDPGAYSILARHAGGAYEAYVGKISTQETVAVNPTGSGGSRTDLVILRIENPYVTGSGSWVAPPDPIDGPYAYVRVIEGVTANINHVSAWNNTWSAITLARIFRPPSTGTILQSHITDLRSLADPSGQRIIVNTTPPSTPPAIAQEYWTESNQISDGTQLSNLQTTWINFPTAASWYVPVPIWAKGMDFNIVYNPQCTNKLYGAIRLVVNDTPTNVVDTEFDVNWTGFSGFDPNRDVIMCGGTIQLDPSWIGKTVNMRMQAQVRGVGNTGTLINARGTRVNVFGNFKKYPVYS